ncbi:ModD protein [Geobacter argillaceus]|uniref:Putative pyrophosphorylase ModD n=1 Tax=Geobacter argillaceus TaxID=345631 RepID=A0A562VK81_9BACT|nr:ModD protein [Geobacter argillaceus]TWJ18288.1 molybdenum transport protein [Geobacter argillaceus]
MINCLPDSDIECFIEEDVPYGDLTTHLLGIGDRTGQIIFSTREETTLCCTEEAARVLRKCGATITSCMPSGTKLFAGIDFLAAQGPTRALHAGWKVALNLLEHASGIASRTQRIVEKATSVNPALSVVTTRKSFPGTKKIAIKAITSGGALPHRLGLSETVLVFKQHTTFLGGLESFLSTIAELRVKARETKIIVEADTCEEALLIARNGADIVQLDKISPDELADTVTAIRTVNPNILISAAGGINESNAAEYAKTGIDIIVLSSVYFGKPSDIGVTIQPV